VTADFAHPEADLSAYRLVVAPASYLLTAAAAENLRRYVEAGGTLLVSYFSGIVDEHDAVHPGGFGAPLRDVLGLTIEEFLPLRATERVGLDVPGLTGDVWVDDIALEGAAVVARYVDGPAAGRPAITRNSFGRGTAWYVSPRLSVEDLATVFSSGYRDAGIVRPELPDEVEVVRRHGIEVDYVVAINHSDDAVALPFEGVELLSDELDKPRVHLVPAGGASVLRMLR